MDPWERNNAELGNAQHGLLQAASVSFNELASLQNLSLRAGKSAPIVYVVLHRGVVVGFDGLGAQRASTQRTCLRKPQDIEHCSEDKACRRLTFIDLSFVRSLSFIVGNGVE